jgi:predicted phosphodiesterase
MRMAVLSDVHANLQALLAVLDDLASHEVDVTLGLGDLVGYNAEPNECLDLLRDHLDLCVAGNHDRAAVGLSVPGSTNRAAQSTLDWTRETLSNDNTRYLQQLPNIVVREHFVAVHGCYLNPDHFYGYVTGSMLEANLSAVADEPTFPQLAFCGHTHQPLIAYLHRDDIVEHALTHLHEWPASSRAVLINPGSVGQPRDRDPRASYVLVDTNRRQVEARRVSYDIVATAAAIARAGLPAALAERLQRGT